jgi:antitoxin VapB
VGSDVVLSSRPLDWSSYLAEAPAASEKFMEGVEDLPVQERES